MFWSIHALYAGAHGLISSNQSVDKNLSWVEQPEHSGGDRTRAPAALTLLVGVIGFEPMRRRQLGLKTELLCC